VSKLVNEASWDRALRIALGLGMLLAGWTQVAPGLWEVALKLFGWYPLVTGIVGWSPLYVLLGITTRRSPAKKHPPD
jgi:hypothetical protein